MTQPETYITENENRFLEDLNGWLRIPSISTLPEHAGDIRRAAEYAADQLRRIGFEQVHLIQTQNHPLVKVLPSRTKIKAADAHHSQRMVQAQGCYLVCILN